MLSDEQLRQLREGVTPRSAEAAAELSAKLEREVTLTTRVQLTPHRFNAGHEKAGHIRYFNPGQLSKKVVMKAFAV